QSNNMSVLLAKFIEAIAVLGYSPRTAVNRKKYVGYFVDWAKERGITQADAVTLADLQDYQRNLFDRRNDNGEPLTFRTQLNYLAAVRAWFKWLAKHNHISCNPAAELELPKTEQRLPKHILTAREAEQVLSVPDVGDVYGLRDRALLELLY